MSKYKKLTEEELKKYINEIFNKRVKSSKRKIVIGTCIKGYKLFKKMLKKEANKNLYKK